MNCRRNLTLTLAWLTLLPFLSPAAPLRVAATLTDFGSIAEVVGGSHVEVTTLSRGTEDAHFVTPRPSFIRVLNRANLLLHGGADLEIGWLPALVKNARNPAILPRGRGDIDMSLGIQLLEIPSTRVDRSAGDVHTLGNPHFWLDPLNSPIMARHLAEVFATFDPEHTDDYRQNAEQFSRQIEQKTTEWEAALAPLRGVKVLTYHKTFEYLAHRFGFIIVAQLEPKPGIEPSPSYIADLIPKARAEKVSLVLIEPFRPRRTPEYIADQIGAQVVILPDKVGALPKTEDTVALFDRIVSLLQASAPQ